MKHLAAILCLGLAVFLFTVNGSLGADFEKGLVAYENGDFATALKELEPLAKEGDADAQMILGSMYQYGEGVPQNYKTAVKWFTIAGKQGYPDALALAKELQKHVVEAEPLQTESGDDKRRLEKEEAKNLEAKKRKAEKRKAQREAEKHKSEQRKKKSLSQSGLTYSYCRKNDRTVYRREDGLGCNSIHTKITKAEYDRLKNKKKDAGNPEQFVQAQNIIVSFLCLHSRTLNIEKVLRDSNKVFQIKDPPKIHLNWE